MKYIEEDLQLTINQKKSKICGATKATFLGFNIQKLLGKLDADLVSRQNNDLKISCEKRQVANDPEPLRKL
ncbi:hypothetical protein ACQYAD_18100 [Neobacillus sp. SM06]|uniref:hypothetical protein n=1 Tax=Neobacillus sp. SM06 TaxID=3422492 RepID=UPI003D2C9AD1